MHTTVTVGKSKVEMLHQVGVGNDHVKHVSSSGLDITLDQDDLSIRHDHSQVPLGGARLPFL